MDIAPDALGLLTAYFADARSVTISSANYVAGASSRAYIAGSLGCDI